MPAGCPGSLRRLHAGRELVDDVLVTRATRHRSLAQPLRTAAIGGLAFTVLYLLHRLLQGSGPDSATAAAETAYNLAHRSILLASEVAVGLALLALSRSWPPWSRSSGRPDRNPSPWPWRLAVGSLWPWALCQRGRDRPNRRRRQRPTGSRAGPGSAAGPHPCCLGDHGPGGGAVAGHPAPHSGLALAGPGRLGHRRHLPVGLGLQRPRTDPRGKLLPCRGGPLHRLDAGAERWSVA